jgi:hypothetical protein
VVTFEERHPRQERKTQMLVLRRKEGQWVEITHKSSGETIRVRVYNIRTRHPGQLDLAFDDDAHNFQVQRPERGSRVPTGEAAVETVLEALAG